MFLACGVGIFLADQWSKHAIRTAAPGLQWGRLVRFHFVAHRKSGFLQTPIRVAMMVAWVLALICSAILYASGQWFQSAMSLAGLGLALGGAAGNLCDILRKRYVVDFIDLGWWPVFNLADVAIVAGLAFAFFG